MMFPKPKRVKNRKIINQVKAQRCYINDACVGQTDAHHLTTQGAGGQDSKDNLFPLCRRHHTEIHAIGMKKFSSRYPHFVSWLYANDRWDLIDKLELD